MRRARTRRERRARERQTARRRRLLAVFALLGVIALAASLPAALIWRQIDRASLVVDERGCAPHDLPRHVVVLIDQSDELSPRWRAFVQALIPAIAEGDGFPPYARLSVYTLTDDAEAPAEEVLSECRPPQAGAGSFLFDTRADRTAREARYAAFYEQAIESAVGRVGLRGPRAATPLIEALVALQPALLREEADATELIVVSDFMQYSDALSHYGRYEPYADFAATRRGAALTAFLGVDRARLFYVRRPELADRQDDAHTTFWRDYFAAAGAEDLDVIDDPLSALDGVGG